MRLTTKINIFFIVALAIALLVSTASFLVMLQSDRAESALKTTQRVDGILDGQMLLFTRDMSRGDIELTKLRANLIEAAYREEGVKIQITDPSGQVLYASRGLSDLLRDNPTGTAATIRNWAVMDDHVVTRRQLAFNGVDLGVLTIGALSRAQSKSFFQNTIIVVFLIISTMSIAGMVLTRIFVSREVVKPLARLVRDVRGVNRYVAGQASDLPAIPERLGAEMSLLYTSLWQSSRDLRNAVDDRGKTLLKLEREQALSRTVQMLAHDVRKPFSMFKIILDSLTASTDFGQMKSFVRQAKKDVLEALQSVEGMIQDIMEIGSNSPPTREPEDPARLIEAGLNSVFRLSDRTSISFHHHMSHRRMVMVDALKANRVFSNILHNAADAMKGRGNITITTEDVIEHSNPYVRFSIANDGPLIPEDHLGNLFDAFFTAGKKGGTGLGLAIAHRIVKIHGGVIWCESSPSAGVVFHFTLPASDLVAPNDIVLPLTSREVYETNQFLTYSPSSSANADEISLEKDFLERIDGGNITVLIADDETLYRSAIEGQIRQSKDVAARVRVLVAKDAEETVSIAREARPDIIIQDIDLGVGKDDGFDVVKTLRADGLDSYICIHSNRGMFQYQETSFRAGANAFLPKPMSRIHLLKLLTGAVWGRSAAKNIETTALPEIGPSVILIEDSDLIRMAWESKMSDARLVTLATPEEALARWRDDATFLDAADYIVIDNNFGEISQYSGVELARTIREQTTATLLLYSEVPMNPLPECFDGYLEKRSYNFDELRALAPRAARPNRGDSRT